MTAGKLLLWLTWSVSLFFQVATSYKQPSDPTSLVLAVLTLMILGLIGRLNDLEQRIAGHVPKPEPKPEIEPAGNEDELHAPTGS